MECWVGVASLRVSTLGFGLPASCLVASKAHVRYRWYLESASRRLESPRLSFANAAVSCGFSWGHESWVCFATVGIDLPASCLMPSLSCCTLYVGSFVGVSTLGVGLWESCRMSSQCSFGLIWSWRRLSDGRYRDGQRRFDNVISLGIPRLNYYSILCRRRDSRRRHAWRRFISVVSCGIPRPICSKDGILCRRRNAYRRGCRRGFRCVMPYVIPGVTYRWIL
jgi:hypothetical protein